MAQAACKKKSMPSHPNSCMLLTKFLTRWQLPRTDKRNKEKSVIRHALMAAIEYYLRHGKEKQSKRKRWRMTGRVMGEAVLRAVGGRGKAELEIVKLKMHFFLASLPPFHFSFLLILILHTPWPQFALLLASCSAPARKLAQFYTKPSPCSAARF